ncbi:MAG: TRAP transporter permease, partial [Halohasta sp.]
MTETPPARSDGGIDDSTDTEGDEGQSAEKTELIEEIERRRSLRGVAAVAVSLIGIAFSVFQLWLAESGQRFDISIPIVGFEAKLLSLQSLQINAIHVSFALILAFLIFPTSTGDGFLSRRLGRLVPLVRGRLGPTHPVTRATETVAAGVRWLFVDADQDRVTPIDLLLVASAVLAPIYMAFEWSEVRRLRVRGFDAIGTVDEVYPFLELPVSVLSAVGIPLDSVSYGFIVGVLGILLVLEATRRALGVYLMGIVSSFIVYARWGYLIPRDGEIAVRIVLGSIALVPPEVTIPYIGVLSITETSWTSVVRDLWFT